MQNIRKQLKEWREARGLTPTELARAARVSKSYISELESGTREKISLHMASKLARGLGITVDELLRGTLKITQVRIEDVEVMRFFSDHWNKLDEDMQDYLRQLIKRAKEDRERIEAERHTDNSTGGGQEH